MPGLTLHPIYAVVFSFAGLALAVLLGLVLYKGEKQEDVSRKESSKMQAKREDV